MVSDTGKASSRSATRATELALAASEVHSSVGPNDPDAIPQIYRRVGWRILPLLFLCYVIAYIDRVNIGFGKLQFAQDLHISDATFGLVTSAFFVGYVMFEVPSNLILIRIGAPATLMRVMVFWGIITSAMCLATGATSLAVLRFLLGAAEAGFFPGVILFIGLWFPNRLRGRAISLFIMAIPVSGIIGGPLSGWIMRDLNGLAGLRGWQWLFLVDGPPAVILGVLAWLLLPRDPARASWLDEPDRRLLENDLAAGRVVSSGPRPGIWAVMRQPQVYLLGAVYFTVASFNTNQVWLPTLLRNAGLSSLTSIGWVSGAVSVGTALGIFLIGRSSDRLLERRWHIAGSGFLATASYVALLLVPNSVPLTACLLAIGTIGGYGVLSLFWTIPTQRLSGGQAALGIAVISTIGQFGGATGPSIVGWFTQSSGNLQAGLVTVALLLACGMGLFLAVTAPRPPGAEA